MEDGVRDLRARELDPGPTQLDPHQLGITKASAEIARQVTGTRADVQDSGSRRHWCQQLQDQTSPELLGGITR